LQFACTTVVVVVPCGAVVVVVAGFVVVVVGPATVVVVVAGCVVVVVGATVVVVVAGCVVVVVGTTVVVVVAGCVVVVVGATVVVVVGAAVVVVVGFVVVVVGAAVVVVVAGCVVVVVGAAVVVVVAPAVVDVTPDTTGIVTMMSVGTAHVTDALRTPLSCTAVVSVTMLSVTDPEAGAVAVTLTSGVVSDAVFAGPPGFPGFHGPAVPYLIWFVAGSDALCGMDVWYTAHCAGLDAGTWFKFAATSDVYSTPASLTTRPTAYDVAADHAVENGTTVAFGGTIEIEPELNVVPLICTVWNVFEYAVTFKPFDCVGRFAVPPGNVTVNVSPGATESGATMPIVMSVGW